MEMTTKNDASQTLFRLVSLRSPQLTEIHRKNLGFIQRPLGVEGVFDNTVSNLPLNTNKINALENICKSNEITKAFFNSEKELEESTFGPLLIVGKKISKKENITDEDWKFTLEFYNKLVDTNKELTVDGIKTLETLWNNLIYQTVSERDFYIKENVSNILKAIHLGFAQSISIDKEFIKINGEKPIENALNGKIVLPKELFIDEQNINQTSESKLLKTTEHRLINEAQTDLLVQNSIAKREDVKKLESELKELQTNFYEQKEKAYNNAYEKYKIENKDIFEEFEKISEQIEKLKASNASEEEINALQEKLDQIKIPSFEYFEDQQIDFSVISLNLSENSYKTFMNLFSTSEVINLEQKLDDNQNAILSKESILENNFNSIDKSIKTFEDVFTKIQDENSSLTQVALNNTPLIHEQYINLEGATIPINQNSQRTPLAYTVVAATGSTGQYISFAFEVENSSWNVLSAKIIADTDYGLFEENYGKISVVNSKISFPPILANKFKAKPYFKIELVFENGREAYGEISKITYENITTGLLNLKSIKIDDSGNENQPKKKNFGIKRVGIADFLKVVQSVHAYVPGLVSNIENVMASELRHKSSVSRDYSEITDTTSKYQETEKVSDTSKTSRTDIQTEIAKELDKQQSITSNTRFSYDAKPYQFEITGGFANNNAQHDSTRQAVMKSQEITEKAMERVLSKISEERVQKIIKEYTETNVHEFDNRGKVTETNNPEAAQPKHITGVYRWIDVKYKNQIYNYGKRTMFEFMVPEPAKLHRLALAVSKGQILTAPTDPRKAEGEWKMSDPKTVTKELLQHWAEIYNVELTTCLPEKKQITHQAVSNPGTNNDFGPDYSRFDIPENYIGKSARFICRSSRNRGGGWSGARYSSVWYPNFKGGTIGGSWYGNIDCEQNEFGLNLNGNVEFGVWGHNVNNYNVNVLVNCELSTQYIDSWKKDCFNAIIKAYDEAYKAFQEEQAKLDEEQKKKEQEAKDKMGKFYRYMEHDVLKHNCIAYLLQDNPAVLGTAFTTGDKMEDFQVQLGEDLDNYTALAKFMEQAFEWEIMDYTFYPYYWANKSMWKEMYISDSVDPLFRSFLQAGMARVIVTVKPGFEDAVQFFMTTGKIWNGGEVPVIGDPLYMSIVDEMRAPVGVPQGKYWITKLPTTLTILQDKSTGLPVEEPLPIFPEANPANCENPSELETKSSFDSRDISLGIEIGKPSTLYTK